MVAPFNWSSFKEVRGMERANMFWRKWNASKEALLKSNVSKRILKSRTKIPFKVATTHVHTHINKILLLPNCMRSIWDKSAYFIKLLQFFELPFFAARKTQEKHGKAISSIKHPVLQMSEKLIYWMNQTWIRDYHHCFSGKFNNYDYKNKWWWVLEYDCTLINCRNKKNTLECEIAGTLVHCADARKPFYYMPLFFVNVLSGVLSSISAQEITFSPPQAGMSWVMAFWVNNLNE